MTSTKLCSRLSLDDFLSFNGPTGTTVGPDGSRGDFFLHLGLSERNNRHRYIYRKMKQEAKAGMNRLFENRKCLQSELVDDESVVPPYSLTQITEFAFQRQVDTIYQLASPQTKGIYDIVRTDNGSNWVIRWMLWRVVQAQQNREVNAVSSGAETEYSTSMLSTCSTAMEYSIPSVKTDQPSPTWWMNTISPHDFSDSEDWDGDVRMKVDPDPMFRKPPPRKPGYWDHVMNT